MNNSQNNDSPDPMPTERRTASPHANGHAVEMPTEELSAFKTPAHLSIEPAEADWMRGEWLDGNFDDLSPQPRHSDKAVPNIDLFSEEELFPLAEAYEKLNLAGDGWSHLSGEPAVEKIADIGAEPFAEADALHSLQPFTEADWKNHDADWTDAAPQTPPAPEAAAVPEATVIPQAAVIPEPLPAAHAEPVIAEPIITVPAEPPVPEPVAKPRSKRDAQKKAAPAAEAPVTPEAAPNAADQTPPLLAPEPPAVPRVEPSAASRAELLPEPLFSAVASPAPAARPTPPALFSAVASPPPLPPAAPKQSAPEQSAPEPPLPARTAEPEPPKPAVSAAPSAPAEAAPVPDAYSEAYSEEFLMDDAQYEAYLEHDAYYEDASFDEPYVMEEPPVPEAAPAVAEAPMANRRPAVPLSVAAPPPSPPEPAPAPARETQTREPAPPPARETRTRETAPISPQEALPPDMPPPSINLRLENTPPEFMHLYASLERQTMGVGDVTLMSGETLGTDRPYVLGITSAIAGEGKTTTALHLAMTIARDTFKKVCLLDLSLGRGDLGQRLGVPSNGIGVVSVLEDADGVVPTLQLTGCDNMVFIPAGRKPTNAARLARSPRVAQLLVSARYSFDVVIVDLPAVASDNALPLTRHMDGLLVVTRAGVTPRDVVSQAVDVLGRDKVVGVALNRSKPAGPAWLHRRFNQG